MCFLHLDLVMPVKIDLCITLLLLLSLLLVVLLYLSKYFV